MAGEGAARGGCMQKAFPIGDDVHRLDQKCPALLILKARNGCKSDLIKSMGSLALMRASLLLSSGLLALTPVHSLWLGASKKKCSDLAPCVSAEWCCTTMVFPAGRAAGARQGSTGDTGVSPNPRKGRDPPSCTACVGALLWGEAGECSGLWPCARPSAL